MAILVAAQEHLLPGNTRREQFANARAYGFTAMEVRGDRLLGHEEEYRRLGDEFGLPITTICGGSRGCLLDPDPAERQAAVDSLLALMRAGTAVGAAHMISVPVFGKPRLPDLSPWQSAVELEQALLLPMLQRIARTAEQERLTARLLLEPLNRYETHFLNRVEQAVAAADRVGSSAIGVIADFFHMQLEEADVVATLRQYSARIDHLHVADSNRKLPGQGHTNFHAYLGELRALGWQGCLALECGILGEPAKELPKAARLLHAFLEV